MRLAAYLCTSRHGIFYFRYPIPMACHPTGGRSHVKISLGTREPRDARHIARLLAVAGQAVLAQRKVQVMRYDAIREHVRDHFGQMLRKFCERCDAKGPVDEFTLDALKAGLAFAEDDTDSFTSVIHTDGATGLLREFCEIRGISEEMEGRQQALMISEFQKGYREYCARAIKHTSEFSALNLEQDGNPARRPAPASATKAHDETEALPFDDVELRYFAELERTKALAAKTEGEKRDALALMSELIGHKPPAHTTRTDAQEVKAVLFKLPKNRSKNPNTREPPLRSMLEVPGVERIGSRTINVYLGHMQHLYRGPVLRQRFAPVMPPS